MGACIRPLLPHDYHRSPARNCFHAGDSRDGRLPHTRGRIVSTTERDEAMTSDASREKTTTVYPVLPLRDIVVFPHMIVPLFVGREKSVRALEDVMTNDKQILLVTQ